MKVRAWAPTVAAAVLVVVTVSLGNWQMRRADEKRALQAQREAAEARAPIDLGGNAQGTGSAGEAAAASAAPPDHAAALAAPEGQRVRVRGRFLPRYEIYLDNRTRGGVAGFEVLAPLRISGSDRHVLVLRGWVAGDPRAHARLPEVRTPDEPVVIEGEALRGLPRIFELAATPAPGPDDRLWQNADLDGFARWSGLPVQPPVVRETAPPQGSAGVFDDGLVREWTQPGFGAERHLGYAFQWYALAVLTAGLWIRFVAFGSRTARRSESAQGDGWNAKSRDDR